jgi:hypothetical protein
MAKDVIVGKELDGSILKEWDINDEKVTIGIKK